MLERLLRILQDGSTHTVADLAGELGVTIPLVEMMLEDLARMGYLSAAAMTCAGQCKGCSQAGCQVLGSSGRVWTSTGKT